jgi:hypothetical protein
MFLEISPAGLEGKRITVLRKSMLFKFKSVLNFKKGNILSVLRIRIRDSGWVKNWDPDPG